MSRYERLATLQPVNRIAAIVTQARGEAFEPSKPRSRRLHLHAPPKPRPCPLWTKDMTGHRYGHLTVISFHNGHPARGSKWLVRCVCGAFETRSLKSIINRGNQNDCCRECSAMNALRRQDLSSVSKKRKPVKKKAV